MILWQNEQGYWITLYVLHTLISQRNTMHDGIYVMHPKK